MPHLAKHQQAHDKRRQHNPTPDDPRQGFRQLISEKTVEQESGKRQRRDQPN
jgi:hypothetical protein